MSSMGEASWFHNRPVNSRVKDEQVKFTPYFKICQIQNISIMCSTSNIPLITERSKEDCEDSFLNVQTTESDIKILVSYHYSKSKEFEEIASKPQLSPDSHSLVAFSRYDVMNMNTQENQVGKC